MEQALRSRAHLERILLVCGEQNSGKSRLLRQMCGDHRLGGEIPSAGPIAPKALSRERCLSFRVSSPHEMGETPNEFCSKIDDACQRAWRDGFWRLSYASAVQPRPANQMPGIVDLCQMLQREFKPERIRVISLAPDQGGLLTGQLTNAEVDGLRKIDVEFLAMDARQRANVPAEPGNVRALADFFDFT